MKIDIITLFPDMFTGPFDTSMLKKAQDNGLVEISVHNLRDWTKDRHKTVDDRPYGGGPGMVLRVDIVHKALSKLKNQNSKVILLSPQGETFSQKKAGKLSKLEHIILLAGHYEGFDERINEHLVDEELSIGNYVLTGGELPAMVITDAIVRLLPGLLSEEAREQESFSQMKNVFDYPVYTRPEEFNGWKVPEILLTGDHKKINAWREGVALEKTKSRKR